MLHKYRSCLIFLTQTATWCVQLQSLFKKMNSQKSVSISEQETNSLPGPSVKPQNINIKTIKHVKKLMLKALQFKSEELKKKFEKKIKLTNTAIRNLTLTIISSKVGKEI